MSEQKQRILFWLARLLIGSVTFVNLQCALAFLFSPQAYASGFDLSGMHGEAVIRSFGILFLMWNVPYVAAFWNPLKQRISLIEAVIMQSIGVIGESLLVVGTPSLSLNVRASVMRFILFDSIGWVFLVAAFFIVRFIRNSREQAFHSDRSDL